MSAPAERKRLTRQPPAPGDAQPARYDGLVFTSPDQITDQRIAELEIQYYRVCEEVACGTRQEEGEP